MNLRAALEARRLELSGQLSGRIRELSRQERRNDRLHSTQCITDRERVAGMLNRFSSALANVERALRAWRRIAMATAYDAATPIPMKRLQTMPWAAFCERCQAEIRGYTEGRLGAGFRWAAGRVRTASGAGLPRRSADDFGTWRRKSAEARKCMKAFVRSLAIALPVKAGDETK